MDISDEIVELAAQAGFDYRPDGKSPLFPWAKASPDARRFHCANMRAALRAAAPALVRAEREACAVLVEGFVMEPEQIPYLPPSDFETVRAANSALRVGVAAIRSRITKDTSP